MATWRLAPTLIQLRNEINAEFPLRDKTSDGSLGNASHAASASDHNPDSRRVVCAIDIDEDLQGSASFVYPRFNPGQPAKSALLDVLLRAAKTGKLPQLYYVIYERKIYSRTNGFAPRAYNGVNAHDHHLHVSVYHSAALADRTVPWGIAPVVPSVPVVAGVTISLPNLLAAIKSKTQHESVRKVQTALNNWRGSLGLDEDGWWGKDTTKAYATYQAWRYGAKLGSADADGIPGAQSLDDLGFKVLTEGKA